VRDGIARNLPHAKELDVKIVVTGGDSLDGISVQEGAQNFYVLFGSITPHDDAYFVTPRTLITRPSTRIFTDAKSSVYLGPLVYRTAAKQARAAEILNVSQTGVISECMRANIFFCTDDEVIVPIDDILLGITRQVIISQLKHAGITVTERTVTIDEVSQMKGAWITGSGIEIIPIHQIDDVVLGDGSIPALATRAIELFRAYTRDYARH
jgi:branched-subunit amino acid aminotransferase/4-amino-4-deoxychorismate lyase